MDLEKYPIDKLSADDLLNRLTEECSELIHAIAKRQRFGATSIHPRIGETGDQRVVSELEDVHLIIKEVERRLSSDGSFDPVSKENDAEYWGGYHS